MKKVLIVLQGLSKRHLNNFYLPKFAVLPKKKVFAIEEL